ncbi:hypothetical protein PR048_026392 [Dryococelus australis]|uniref:Uncharacterized protein n=1 Tax=Dryococelus australis TaxID=614101 RepID=A0ABQ9GL58_9NEOP|nr:hypothetical protein PR048_026392 [Dryococelus australis]
MRVSVARIASSLLVLKRAKHIQLGAAVPQWLGRSPPTTAIRARFPADSLQDFRMWESCKVMPLAGGFSRGTALSPALAFERRSVHVMSRNDGHSGVLPRLSQHIVDCVGIWGTPGAINLRKIDKRALKATPASAFIPSTLRHNHFHTNPDGSQPSHQPLANCWRNLVLIGCSVSAAEPPPASATGKLLRLSARAHTHTHTHTHARARALVKRREVIKLSSEIASRAPLVVSDAAFWFNSTTATILEAIDTDHAPVTLNDLENKNSRKIQKSKQAYKVTDYYHHIGSRNTVHVNVSEAKCLHMYVRPSDEAMEQVERILGGASLGWSES